MSDLNTSIYERRKFCEKREALRLLQQLLAYARIYKREGSQ
jgi:hypothetical protein